MVAFLFVVYSVTTLIAWIVPDVPENLKFKRAREKQVVKDKLGGPGDDDEEEEESEDEDVEEKNG